MTDKFDSQIQLDFHDLRNTRDLRTLLLEASYALLEQPDFEVQINLHQCTLARKRVQMEFEQFKKIVQPQFGARIRLHDDRASGVGHTFPVEAITPVAPSFKKPGNASREAVVAYLLERYLHSSVGVSVKDIAEQTQASLPTVYAVLKAYVHCIERDREEKTLRLHTFNQGDWLQWIQRSNRLSSVYFIDRSRTPRSTNRLAKELARLKRADLAIGGLMGALHHLPALVAPASPQLDILVHGTRRASLSFISELAPGLELHKGRADMANVVVHFIDRPASLFTSQGGQRWGSLPDCIANMQMAELTHQVHDALQLIKTRPETS